jgi:hypothetical protein
MYNYSLSRFGVAILVASPYPTIAGSCRVA